MSAFSSTLLHCTEETVSNMYFNTSASEILRNLEGMVPSHEQVSARHSVVCKVVTF